jgi:hypothetical protein
MFALHGLPPDGALPCLQLLLDRVHPADRHRTAEALAAACSGRAFSLELRGVRPGCSPRPLVLVGEPRRDADGAVTAVDGLCIDLTNGRRRSEDDRVQDLEAEVAQLRTAMASRAAIEQAKGILMLLTNCGDQVAFDLLAHISSHTHRKVRDVAVALVGSAAGQAALPDDIAAILRDHPDVWVYADEIYSRLCYEDGFASIAALPGMYERTITCYTLSKSYSMTGWRIGYAIAPEPWLTGLRKTLLYSTNGVSTPTQWAAVAAINSPTDFFDNARAAYRQRRDLLVGGLNELGLTCAPPAGAFYAFPDATHIAADSRRAAEILLERAQVATVPGVVFGPHGEGHLRFSFSTSIETIEAGLDSMRRQL